MFYSRLAQAMDRGDLCFYYQGKFGTADARLAGLEALLRWRDPLHGMIFPQDIIGRAEQSAAIIELGKWGIDSACRQLARWRREGLPLVPVAVNISVWQLSDGDLYDTVQHCLSRYSLPPALLEIELTESGEIVDMAQACATLQRLRVLGVRIALDDYGTGYAGLMHLKMLPLDTLKMDRCFIDGVDGNGRDALIVASSVALACALGLEVVAEGVETAAQLAGAHRLGCHQAQGYYLHRPAPAADIAPLLGSAGTPAA